MNIKRSHYFAVALIFLVSRLSWGAATLYVSLDGTNDGGHKYDSWSGAATNIEWAVNAGINGDTVWVSNGTYYLTNQITVRSNITIIGTAGVVTVNGNNSGRCFYFTAPTCALANIFVTGGYTNEGAGLYMNAGRGQVRDCVFSNNLAYSYGGAVYINGGSNLLQSCTLVENRATNEGGGLYLFYTYSLDTMVAGCTFHGNVAAKGGGMSANRGVSVITGCYFTGNIGTNRGGGANFYNLSTVATSLITHCTFDGNVASLGIGGGMYVAENIMCSNSFFSNNIAGTSGGGMVLVNGAFAKNCTVASNTVQLDSGVNSGGGGISVSAAAAGGAAVENCTIEKNRSGYWGGGLWVGDWAVIRNCLIRNNVAKQYAGVSGQGGGIHFFLNDYGRTPVISSCTVVSNYASYAGGGINNGRAAQTTVVENCVIYLNSATTLAGASNLYDKTVTVYSNCCVAGFTEATNISLSNCITNQNPRFADWPSGNYRLTRDSPCINAGVNRDWMAGVVDLEGHGRVDNFSGIVDIGCYEYLPSGVMFKMR